LERRDFTREEFFVEVVVSEDSLSMGKLRQGGFSRIPVGNKFFGLLSLCCLNFCIWRCSREIIQGKFSKGWNYLGDFFYRRRGFSAREITLERIFCG